MASKAAKEAGQLSILEPGAGNGLLTAAVIGHCMDSGLCSSFSVRFIENDPEILPVLRITATLILHYVQLHHGSIEISISTDNYITGEENGQYDIVICNPPYRKIRKDPAESLCMSEHVFGQPNLYTLFMCKAVNNLKTGGKFVFITPRSWTSGNYYKVARRFVLGNLNLTDLLLFEDRDNSYRFSSYFASLIRSYEIEQWDDGTVIGLEDPDGSALQVNNMIRDAKKPDLTMFLHNEAMEIDGNRYSRSSAKLISTSVIIRLAPVP